MNNTEHKSQVRHKCVLVIIDGLGDVPIHALNDKTPLEAADTPVMDRLAAAGSIGLVDPIRPGTIPGTHSGTGLLMGLLPTQVDLLSRGPVEAAGLGRVLEPGEVALRANFATLERHSSGYHIRDRRAGRITQGADELAALLKNVDLGDGVQANLLSTDQHRAALILSGPGLDARISDTDPKDRGMPSDVILCRHTDQAAELTSSKINLFMEQAYQRLVDHPVNIERIRRGAMPANGVLTRSAGSQYKLDNILQQLGVSTALVSGCNTVRGLGRIFGFNVISDPRFTAGVNTDLVAKVSAAESLLDEHDLVFIHIKGTDICSHDRQPLRKRDLLQRLDQAIEPLLDAGVVIAVGADHTTDSVSGSHTADPVPALIAPPGSNLDKSRVKFGESHCRKGKLGGLSNSGFLSRVLNEMGISVP